MKTNSDRVGKRSPGSAYGIPTLDSSTKVVQNPANATATPTASKIPIADGSGKLDGWVTVYPTTQSVVTGSRSLDTVYQNTTGRPMRVRVQVYDAAGGQLIQALTDASNPPTTQLDRCYTIGSSQEVGAVDMYVMPTHYYKVTCSGTPTIRIWVEAY